MTVISWRNSCQSVLRCMQLAGLSVGRGEFVIVVKQQKTEKFKKSITSRRMRVRG